MQLNLIASSASQKAHTEKAYPINTVICDSLQN